MSRMKESMLRSKNSVNWSAQTTTKAIFKYFEDNGHILKIYIEGQKEPIKCTSGQASNYQQSVKIAKQLSDGDQITYKSRGVDAYSSKLWFYSISKNVIQSDEQRLIKQNLTTKETYSCEDCNQGTLVTEYDDYYSVGQIPYYAYSSTGLLSLKRFGSFGDYDIIQKNQFKITSKDLEQYRKILSDDNDFETIGWHYEHGINTNLSNIMGERRHPNFLAALNYYLKSEEQQASKNVQERIGILYEIGEYGLDRNYKEAAKWYQKALDISTLRKDSNQGTAPILLARLYLEGLGVSQDINKALDLLKKSGSGSITGNFLFDLKEGYTSINSEDLYLQLARFYYSNVGANIDYLYGENYVISKAEKLKLYCKWADKHSQTNKPISLIEAAQETMLCQDSQESLRALYYLNECSKMGFGATDKALWSKLIKQGCLHKYYPNGDIKSKGGPNFIDSNNGYDWRYSEYGNDGSVFFEVFLIKEFYEIFGRR